MFKTRQFPTWVYNLTHLKTLRLGNNKIVGTIGSEIGKLSKLSELQLTLNGLSGTLPTELSLLVHLTSIALEENFFSGTLPLLDSLSQLLYLAVDHNNLEGDIPPLPIKLSHLSFPGNLLSGTIPDVLPSSLTCFSGASNNLQGIFPSSFCLEKMGILDVAYNPGIVGTLPFCLWSSTSLTILVISGTNISGTLPKKINSQSLVKLYVSSTRIGGYLPEFSASNMDGFYGNSCDFYGTIPYSYGYTMLELSMNYNQLSGYYPSNICNLSHVNLMGNNDLYCPRPSCCSDIFNSCPKHCALPPSPSPSPIPPPSPFPPPSPSPSTSPSPSPSNPSPSFTPVPLLPLPSPSAAPTTDQIHLQSAIPAIVYIVIFLVVTAIFIILSIMTLRSRKGGSEASGTTHSVITSDKSATKEKQKFEVRLVSLFFFA